MKDVPYHGNPGNACALACYTMSARYLLPKEDITFENFGKLANWKKGYVIWAFPIWKWLMDKGVKIDDYDTVDYSLWAKEGTKGLRKSLPPKAFKFVKDNTYDLDEVSKQAVLALDYPNFKYTKCHVTWEMIVKETSKPGICEVGLDGRMLHRKEGFTLHRVVLIEINDKEVIFHDPTFENDGAYKREPVDFFRKCVESVVDTELCRYYL